MPTNLESDHHFFRHVPSTRLKRREEDDVVYGVFPHAFERRVNEETLSGSWLEFFDAPHRNRLERSAQEIHAMRDVVPRSGFFVALVGKIHSICDGLATSIRIMHDPSKKVPNPAYATIRNLPNDNLELLAHLANEACVEVYVATDLLPELKKS